MVTFLWKRNNDSEDGAKSPVCPRATENHFKETRLYINQGTSDMDVEAFQKCYGLITAVWSCCPPFLIETSIEL